jgi:hypothetical protein
VDSNQLVNTVMNRHFDASLEDQIGDKITLAADPQDLHVFDLKSGLSIG